MMCSRGGEPYESNSENGVAVRLGDSYVSLKSSLASLLL